MSFKDFAKKTSGVAKPGLPEYESAKPAAPATAPAPKDKDSSGQPNKTATPS